MMGCCCCQCLRSRVLLHMFGCPLHLSEGNQTCPDTQDVVLFMVCKAVVLLVLLLCGSVAVVGGQWLNDGPFWVIMNEDENFEGSCAEIPKVSDPMAVRATWTCRWWDVAILRPLELERISLFFFVGVLVGYVEVFAWVWSDEMASRQCLRLRYVQDGGNLMVGDSLWWQMW